MDDGIQVAVDVGREALIVAAKISMPILLTGLMVGLVVSLFQALTQIQEQTLAFIPKIFAVVATVFLILPWILSTMAEYMTSVVYGMNDRFP